MVETKIITRMIQINITKMITRMITMTTMMIIQSRNSRSSSGNKGISWKCSGSIPYGKNSFVNGDSGSS